MAIIKCPNCGRQLSDKGGGLCPTCGTSVSEIAAWQAGQKPQKKRGCAGCLIGVLAVIGAFVVISIIGMFLFSGNDSSSASSGSSNKSQGTKPSTSNSQTQTNTKPQTQAPAPDPKPAAVSDSGDLGDYYVNIKEAYTVQDYEGNPAIVVTFSWTNNSDKTTSSAVALYMKAFQGGVQLDNALIFDTDLFDSSGYLKDIRPGASLDVQQAFKLRNNSSDVEIEVSELISFSDDIVGTTFKLS